MVVSVTKKTTVAVSEDSSNYDKSNDSLPSVVAKEATAVVVYETRYIRRVDSPLLEKRKESIEGRISLLAENVGF